MLVKSHVSPSNLGTAVSSVPIPQVAGSSAYPVLPRGMPIPKGARQNRRDSGVSAAVWEWLHLVHTSFSHGASVSPKRPRQDQGTKVYPPLCGSGCTLCILRSPTGRPYTPSGPGTTRGTQVYPPLCGSSWALCIPRSPTGRPYPPSGRGRTGGTGVYPTLSGSGWSLCILVLPRAIPIRGRTRYA